MDNNIDGLKKLIEKIKTISFWERLFSWKSVRQQLVEAASDLQKLISNYDNLKELNTKLTSNNSELSAELRGANENVKRLEGDNKNLSLSNNGLSTDNKKLVSENATNNETITNLTERKNELGIELTGVKTKLELIEIELKTIKQQNTQLLADEENRKKKYENETATLTSIREQIQADRKKEIEDRNNAEFERIKNLKDTWGTHQENVKNIIKGICNKHTIEYINKVPFKGEPDNALKICDEFVIFDAKSPASDDLTNFPSYIKDQAEKAKKYAKQENVKLDIFFVIPTNTLEKLSQFVFNLADYNVFVISVDSLEQIILSLKKIEDYEFAEQLSPEERDNICRVLGKFAHLTKRRIQIDSFFAKQFIELAYKSETDLPKEILDKVIEFEKSEKLNPPIEKRAKAINIKELEKDTAKISNEANSKGIVIDDTKISTGLNELQLYKYE
ncbi:MAG: hypothetical protein JST94_07825 [Bacteroidetes bacterium]|nr:hypothetical protein [Bacteroidota bacterium]